VEAAGGVLLLVAEAGDGRLARVIGDDDEGLPLGEAGAGGVAREGDDAVHHLRRHRLVGEVAHHAAA
jgi:hypothetical protein